MKVTKKVRSAGSALASHRWSSKSMAERKRILALVRAEKKAKPRMSDTFAFANAILRNQNQHVREGR